MLEADAIERVVQLDVHAQVVAVELELVAGKDAAILGGIHCQRGDFTVDRKRPVPIPGRIGAVVDARFRISAVHR